MGEGILNVEPREVGTKLHEVHLMTGDRGDRHLLEEGYFKEDSVILEVVGQWGFLKCLRKCSIMMRNCSWSYFMLSLECVYCV